MAFGEEFKNIGYEGYKAAFQAVLSYGKENQDAAVDEQVDSISDQLPGLYYFIADLLQEDDKVLSEQYIWGSEAEENAFKAGAFVAIAALAKYIESTKLQIQLANETRDN